MFVYVLESGGIREVVLFPWIFFVSFSRWRYRRQLSRLKAPNAPVHVPVCFSTWNLLRAHLGLVQWKNDNLARITACGGLRVYRSSSLSKSPRVLVGPECHQQSANGLFIKYETSHFFLPLGVVFSFFFCIQSSVVGGVCSWLSWNMYLHLDLVAGCVFVYLYN